VADPHNEFLGEETNRDDHYPLSSEAWLALPVIGILVVSAWAFIAFCEPSGFQTIVFCGLLVLFFFETIVADWYTPSSNQMGEK
jgi:hypothetical protein